MPRQHLSSPLIILLAGVIMIALLLVGTSASTNAITRQQSSGTPTACPSDGSEEEFDCEEERAQMTADAQDATPTDDTSYPYAAPGTATATLAPTASGSVATATATLAATADIRSSAATFTPSTNQSVPSAEADNESGTLAQATPTATIATGLICAPGAPVIIDGIGPPRAPLLLFFDERPVGGGIATASGSFGLKLIVGKERPGQYQVMVRVRGTSQVVRSLTCTVP